LGRVRRLVLVVEAMMEYHKYQDHQRQIPDVTADPKMIGRKV